MSSTWCSFSSCLAASRVPIVKKKYAFCCLCGQERLCRISGLALRITPAMLNLRARDDNMLQLLKVTFTTWAAHARGRALAPFWRVVMLTRFTFLQKSLGEHVEWRRDMRQKNMDHTHQGLESINMCPFASSSRGCSRCLACGSSVNRAQI